jgi:hypothetical protein
VGSALRSARSGTADFATILGRTMSHHPLPVLLTGTASLGWSSRRSGENGEPRREVASYDPDHMSMPGSPPVDRGSQPGSHVRQAADGSPPGARRYGSSGAFGTAPSNGSRERRYGPIRCQPTRPMRRSRGAQAAAARKRTAALASAPPSTRCLGVAVRPGRRVSQTLFKELNV